MLRKPRRGWWVVPGGKVEPTETWLEAVTREVWEETGLTISGLTLRGVHRIRIEEADGHIKDRLIAQFSALEASGNMLEECKEGKLDTIAFDELAGLPMDEGDRIMIQHALAGIQSGQSDIYFGKFTYTLDHQLVSYHISLQLPMVTGTTTE
jgi:8-oxo-dGTP diphosphatase